ncbi:ferrochelatase [Allobranchiibius huperziae]|uniref:Coproporphyrin III ferrochelatase n=2 Tax=Dermacoccaceae TaxID=145357 RepID=A0A853DLI2_9MICO|nr:ferrochelatase [Allobranchiibius huperziae]
MNVPSDGPESSHPEEPVAPAARPLPEAVPAPVQQPEPGGVSEEVLAAATEPVPDPGPQEELAAMVPYDAVVLLSFGGPEAPEEVMPFLRRVTAGRGIPDERLESVAKHYYDFGGVSPINDQCRALRDALHGELRRRGIATPVLWGNRNGEPFLVDTLREAYDGGARRVLVVTTSAYSSYSSCRQYREDIAAAQIELQDEGLELAVDKIRPYATHPSFSRVNTRLVTDAVRACGQPDDEKLRVVFVTHSIPEAMDDTSGPGDGEGSLYEHQHDEIAHVILDEAGITLDRDLHGALVYCSRSGAPGQPWLEPDVNDHLRELAAKGVTDVVVAPIGFVSDHMEVKYDLDTEARATADELGLRMTRVPTVGVDPEFVSGLVDLAEERAAQARGEQVLLPAWPGAAMPSVCAAGCCPNLRTPKPAACGSD